MQSNRWPKFAVAIGLMVGLLGLWGHSTRGQAPAAKPAVVWEYKTLYVGADPASSLNELGQQGWELVTSSYSPTAHQQQHLYIFKRQKP